MESHDLGCGAGDGETSEDIFTNAGLTILTNANINATRIIEETKECADKKRARHYVYKTSDSYGGIRRYVPSNDDQQLLDNIGSCGYVSLKKVRDNFNTTVLFDEITPRETCFETKLSHSDSITTWTVQAIGISPSNEACLIETRNEVKAFKEFFIQVNVPYKVTRNITFHVHVTVFNYLQKEIKVRVYLKTANELCYGISNEETFQQQLLHMSQNSATTLAFPFVPLEYGTYPIIVSAFASNEHTSISDIVRKEVVVSEARPMTVTVDHSNIFNICLDTDEEPRCQSSPDGVLRAHSNMGETPTVSIYFEIPLPENYIPGTNKAIAHIKEYKSEQRIWCLINGIGGTFYQPGGNGATTMRYVSPIAYGLDFLKYTDTLDIQQMEQWTGYLRQDIFGYPIMTHLMLPIAIT
ncbi:CD109 antigen-like [Dreissena polymorpha]|uniref:CD109 antigen-like n=1 Tax=Dreissena polymorpha TaxID=45954 RepID=UPI002264895F|nr:CD109 antigen-like [Dreissena polymorpha]